MTVRKSINGAFDPARRRRAHPGQVRGSARKQATNIAQRAELKAEAAQRGVDPLKIVLERQEAVDRVVAEAAAKKRQDEKRYWENEQLRLYWEKEWARGRR